jgi:t-SNARE complex subunit (syntaxin)
MKSAQQQLTELQDRHDEFIKLEKSIKEVHDMFLEIANLVTQQVCLEARKSKIVSRSIRRGGAMRA